MKMKSSEIAATFGFSVSCVRRWAREFLPPDPRAVIRSGYTRKFGPGEVLTILVGGLLVDKVPFGFPDARQVAQAIISRLSLDGGQQVDWPHVAIIRFLVVTSCIGDPRDGSDWPTLLCGSSVVIQDPRFPGGVEASMAPVSVAIEVGCVFSNLVQAFSYPGF